MNIWLSLWCDSTSASSSCSYNFVLAAFIGHRRITCGTTAKCDTVTNIGNSIAAYVYGVIYDLTAATLRFLTDFVENRAIATKLLIMIVANRVATFVTIITFWVAFPSSEELREILRFGCTSSFWYYNKVATFVS